MYFVYPFFDEFQAVPPVNVLVYCTVTTHTTEVKARGLTLISILLSSAERDVWGP
jgi:hypothetical protein